VAVINVGAATESEMKEKKPGGGCLECNRAAGGRRSRSGGGVAYLRSLPALDKLKLSEPSSSA